MSMINNLDSLIRELRVIKGKLDKKLERFVSFRNNKSAQLNNSFKDITKIYNEIIQSKTHKELEFYLRKLKTMIYIDNQSLIEHNRYSNIPIDQLSSNNHSISTTASIQSSRFLQLQTLRMHQIM